MKYPQAYLFIRNEGKAISHKWLKGLANGAAVYMSKQSRRNDSMEELVAMMKEAASIANDECYCSEILTVVVQCNAINELMLLALGAKLASICWLGNI